MAKNTKDASIRMGKFTSILNGMSFMV